MAKLELKYESLNAAKNTLENAINHFEKVKKLEKVDINNLKYEDIYISARSSLIQSFEFTIELYWKYLKLFLETKNVLVETNTPGDVIRSACKASLISEDEAEAFIKMLKSRNLTSHVYKEEIAEQIAKDVINFYDIIKQNVNRLKPKI